MRRAEWRGRADDPKTLLGWWWRGLWAGGWPLALTFGSLLGYAFFTGAIWLSVLAIVLCLTGGTAKLVCSSDRLATMLPDPAPEGQFRATVEYRQKGLTTGHDEMALTVVDGWLHAEGVRSHFALRPQDVGKLTTGSDRRGRLVLSDGSEIWLAGLDDPARIVLERWHGPNRWMEGEPTFPPARVHPQEIARWSARSSLGLAWIFLPNVLASYCHLGGGFWELRFGVALVGAGIFYWTRRRLDQLTAISIEANRRAALADQAPPLSEELPESLTAKRL